MASVVKRPNGKWRAEVRIKGRYKSKSFTTEVDAWAWAAQMEREFKAMRGEGLVGGKTVADAFVRYVEEVTPGKKGARWELVRLNKLKSDPISNGYLENLCVEDVQEWVDRRLKCVSGASVNRELNLISAVFSVAAKRWRWLGRNPCADVERPKNPPHRDRRIAEVEINRILEALGFVEGQPLADCRQAIAVAFLLALETAMRQGEIWGLVWDNVFLDQQFLRLPDTKNGTRRDVPLSKRAVQLLRMLQALGDGKRVVPFNQASCATLFRRAVALADIHDLTFHDTRHEALTRLASKLDMLALARMVGHRDPRSLMIYYNPTASELAEQLD